MLSDHLKQPTPAFLSPQVSHLKESRSYGNPVCNIQNERLVLLGLHCVICLLLPVATGFPAGQTPLETRLQEVRIAVSDGATEIDIVINRMLAITGQWEGMLQPHCGHCDCM